LKFSAEFRIKDIGKTVTRAKPQRTNIRSTKSEARNSKQIQMFKKTENFKQRHQDSAFWIFFGFGFIWLRFVSVRRAAFVLRILDLFRWLPGGINFPEVVMFNISEVRI